MSANAMRRTARATELVAKNLKGAPITYIYKGEVCSAVKLCPAEFGEAHRRALASLHLGKQRELYFGVPGWRSCWVGAGEEKVVYLIIDPQQRAFAIEVLSKSTYLEGFLTEGHYFGEIFVPGLCNVRWDERSLFGHIFSGRIKAREYIYGETLAGPGLLTEHWSKANFLARLIGRIGHSWASFVVAPRYNQVRKFYRDTHEANVMIEVMPLSNPEGKDHYMFPVPWLEEDGKIYLRFYRLTPIDVRMPMDVISD